MEYACYDLDFRVMVRELPVAVIAKHSSGIDLDTYVHCLAMNYFARYFSRNLLQDGREDICDKTRVLAICCFTIAAKTRRKSFSVDQFLKERFVDDISHQQVLLLELRILKGLQWQMRPVTPFCYLEYYYCFHFKIYGGFKGRDMNENIVQSQRVTWFTQFKPSHVALSSFLAAAAKVHPKEFDKLEKPDEVKIPCMNELISMSGNMNIYVLPLRIGSSASNKPQSKSAPAILNFLGRPDPVPLPITQRRPEAHSAPDTPLRPSKAVATEAEQSEPLMRQAKGKAVTAEDTDTSFLAEQDVEDELVRLREGPKINLTETQPIFEELVKLGNEEKLRWEAKGKAVVVAEEPEPERQKKVPATIRDIAGRSRTAGSNSLAGPSRLASPDMLWPRRHSPSSSEGPSSSAGPEVLWPRIHRPRSVEPRRHRPRSVEPRRHRPRSVEPIRLANTPQNAPRGRARAPNRDSRPPPKKFGCGCNIG